MPSYYPAFIDVRNRKCVVIGGGSFGEENVHKLLNYDAKVIVVSAEIADGVRKLVDTGQVEWVRRDYEPGDLAGTFIAVAATGDKKVSAEIAQEAEERNVLLNVVDVTRLCTFIAPSVARRGEVTVATSTGGASPALARKFREELANSRILEYADLAPLLSDARIELKENNITVDSDHWQKCLTEDLLDAVQAGRAEDAKQTLMANLLSGPSTPCAPAI